jgi:hypothetical protein
MERPRDYLTADDLRAEIVEWGKDAGLTGKELVQLADAFNIGDNAY